MCLKQGTLPPYLGSTIRGVMGHCFRKFACTRSGTKCFCCDRRETCSYVRYFSNTGKEGGAINPYVIGVFNDGKTEWNKGDTCTFDLTLFGNAAEQAGIYLDALVEMERIGWGVSQLPFQLLRVSNTQTGKLIYAPGHMWIRNLSCDFLTTQDKEAKTVFISFDTPLRIVSGRKLCIVPSFEMIIQFILRRFSLMTQVHTNQKMEWDEEKILELAGKVALLKYHLQSVNFKRYSINQKDNKLELPAIEGWAMYEGDLAGLIPILEAGKYLHIGKGSTIGFGHYETFYDGG